MTETPPMPLLDVLEEALESRTSEQEGPIFVDMDILYPFPVSAENPELAYLEGYESLPSMVIFMSDDTCSYALLAGDEPPEASPVVYLSDEGEAEIVAGNLRDFFDLLLTTIDAEFDEELEEFEEARDRASEECGELFDELRRAIGLDPVDLPSLHARVLAAREKHEGFSLGAVSD